VEPLLNQREKVAPFLEVVPQRRRWHYPHHQHRRLHLRHRRFFILNPLAPI
jgi:hypothetical protein